MLGLLVYELSMNTQPLENELVAENFPSAAKVLYAKAGIVLSISSNVIPKTY